MKASSFGQKESVRGAKRAKVSCFCVASDLTGIEADSDNMMKQNKKKNRFELFIETPASIEKQVMLSDRYGLFIEE
ncbi:hypothetical protein [Vibrio salinus]|uniref:hypothetical protein n=1 Tax=Vibrio salinus TaxID=2899784 RepID=UPI001E41210B|nr:hypothetical protein [Vibrio salinus]MCE0494611.1 hypothetical protein [Vibrio salinus]